MHLFVEYQQVIFLISILFFELWIMFIDADEEMEENPMAYKLRWETGYLNGAPFKVRLKFVFIFHFFFK